MSTSSSTRAEALHSLMALVWAPGEEHAPRPSSGRQTGPKKGKALPQTYRYAPISSAQAYKIVKRGIPSRSLIPLGEYLGLGKAALAEFLDMDRATAARKVTRDDFLPTHAAESVLRLLELDQLAEETFATPEEAAAWLQKPHPMLDGEAPMVCAKSAYGAQRVKEILIALLHGGAV